MANLSPAAKLVVGLGNPGRRYQGTRHNVGFMVLRQLRRRWDFGRGRSKFHAKIWTGKIARKAVTLAAPHTYMNRSGQAVAEVVAFCKARPEDVLVVMDDMALPTGKLRARARGSAGGHKGLDDILRALDTEALPRLRIGIGAPPEGADPVEYVLGRFDKTEEQVIAEAAKTAAAAVEDWACKGIEYVMNHYNSPGREAYWFPGR